MEILTPVGRIVGGHPMTKRPIKDEKTNQPVMDEFGKPKFNFYFALAIAKTTPNWNQTEWGQAIQAVATSDFPNGEWQRPNFAFKITDGDSTIPNQKGKVPSKKEGFPGHWVLNLSTNFPIKCFFTGKFNPMDQIQDEAMIKPGDYVRVLINAKGNQSTQSPGVYLNPEGVEVVQAGERIVLESDFDAGAAFGGQPAQMPANVQPMIPGAQQHASMPNQIPGAPLSANVQAMVPGVVPGQATPPIIPAPDLLQPRPEATYNLNGVTYTHSQLKSANWSDEQIAQLK